MCREFHSCWNFISYENSLCLRLNRNAVGWIWDLNVKIDDCEDFHQVVGKKSHKVVRSYENEDYNEMDPPANIVN